MSTNNNLLGKEVRPIWKNADGKPPSISKLSGISLQRLISNKLEDCNAMPLGDCGISKIDDLIGLGGKLRRLDLSNNQIARLNGFSLIPNLSLLNLTSNNFTGDSGLEELRYLTELRTLNIGKNPNIRNIKSHILKPLIHLQALICNDCGLEKASFIRFLPMLNTLILSHNNIKSMSLHEMDLSFKYQHLCKISLSHNGFDRMPKFFPYMPALEEIKISNNSISDITDEFIAFYAKKLKTFDISHNAINDWNVIEKLKGLTEMTNFSAKGNPLPALPAAVEQTFIKEDISAASITDPEEHRYRINVLHIFQKMVGKNDKHFIQLIVLDNKRVKMKWTQGGAAESYGKQDDALANKNSEKKSTANGDKRGVITSAWQKRKPEEMAVASSSLQQAADLEHPLNRNTKTLKQVSIAEATASKDTIAPPKQPKEKKRKGEDSRGDSKNQTTKKQNDQRSEDEEEISDLKDLGRVSSTSATQSSSACPIDSGVLAIKTTAIQKSDKKGVVAKDSVEKGRNEQKASGASIAAVLKQQNKLQDIGLGGASAAGSAWD